MSPSGPALTVTAVSPASGSTTGGTSVTITGTGFGADAVVTIGGAAATAVAVTGSTLIAATAEAHAAGAANVTVTSAGHTGSLTGAFTFVAPSGLNQPPAIASIRTVGSRPNQPSGFGDLNELLTIIADVSDRETPNSSLQFQWSGAGSFSESASSASWQLPASAPTPTTITATLTVTESYVESGVTHRNVSARSFALSLHDSQKEIFDAGIDFLTRFGDSSIPTDSVLHKFSATCDGGQGRSHEADDVDKAHRDVLGDPSKTMVTARPPVLYLFGGRCPVPGRTQTNVDACSSYAVHWESTPFSGDNAGRRVITEGIDHVSAVLENNEWKLCHSDFLP